jgi:hypothetical protein
MLRGKVTLLFMMLGMLLAIPAIALADDVQDELTGGVNNTTRTIATSGPGNEFENTYFIKAANNDPNNTFNGCNVSSTNPAYVKIVQQGGTSLPSGVSATYPAADPNDPLNVNNMKFTACGSNLNDTANTRNVTFTGSTPGTYQLTAIVTGPGTYDVSEANFTLVVKKATEISNVSGSATVGGTATLKATLSSAYQQEGALSGKPVQFRIGTTVVGTDSATDSAGLAELNNVTLPAGFTTANTYNDAVTASFAGDTAYFQSSGTGNLTVNPACTTPAAPVFDTKSSDATGDNGWFNASDGVPTILATSTTGGATITYATEVNGGPKSAYSPTAPTLGQGTTKVYAKATNGSCPTTETIDTFKVDTVAPSITDGESWTQALPGNARTPDGNDSWYVSEVFNKFTASDATSGLVGQTSPYIFTKGSGTDQGSAVKVSSGVISDMAGNTNSLDSAEYKIDLAAPTGVAGSPDRGPDSNGWYNSPVSFTFTGTDTVSDIASCSTPTYSGPDGTGKTVDGSCTDNAGNQSASVASSAIDYDATAPVIANVGADSTFSTPNAAGWYKTDVRHKLSATDNLSGFGTSGALTLNFHKDISQEGSAVTTSSGTQTDQAGNVATAITSSPAYKIDKTKPSVSVTGVSQGGAYTYGNVPTPGCNTTDGLSDVKTPASVSVTGGTGGFGTLTATCSGAVDNADNAQDPVSVTYTVSATFHGWLQPVDGDGSATGTLNIGKVGRTYPIKWQLKDSSGALLSDTTAQLLVGTMSGGQVKKDCGSFSVTDADTLEESLTGNTSLRYDAISDQFIYNYKAPSTLGCYAFAIKNADGATIKQANFDFRK